MRVDERREGDGDEHELGERGALPHAHQGRIADVRAPGGDESLRQRRAERENEGEMTDLDNHLALASPSCHRPCFFSASTTSRGI